MPSYQDRFLDKENFYLAFKKLKAYLDQANEWYNPVELEAYEAQLPANIYRLLERIENQTYTPKPIQPLPFPKKNKEDIAELRPYFRVSLDDQLIWIAIINVIGDAIETKLPFWNYGNRLFRPIWFESDENGNKELKKGSYANSSSWFYRKWNQSWPLYRRHITIAIKVMARNVNFSLTDLADEKEQQLFEENAVASTDKILYFDKDFWPSGEHENLYWAGLDFTRFFPSVDADLVIENMGKLLAERTDVGLIIELAKKMLTYPIENTWDAKFFTEEYQLNNADFFTGLPTGLYAAGFLANLSLYDIDVKLQEWIVEKKQIALFKYVDDQIIISTSPDALLEFLNFYQDLLKQKAEKISFQSKKTAPQNVFIVDEHGRFQYEKLKGNRHGNELDVQFPEPLMTHTLKKMSDLNGEDFDLSNSDDLEKAQDDLEHFLIADFADAEMRRDTRMSFAAMKLCQLARHIRPDFSKLDHSLEVHKNTVLAQIALKLKKEPDPAKQRELINLALNAQFQKTFRSEIAIVKRKYRRIFSLLIKACKENPDKIKLWRRTVEFCFHTGYDGMQDIIDTVHIVEIHGESKVFIVTYCNLILQKCLIQAYNNIMGSTSDFWRTYTSWIFMLNAESIYLKLAEAEDSYRDYPFVRETFFNFKVLAGLTFQCLKTIPEKLSIVTDLVPLDYSSTVFDREYKMNLAFFNRSYFSKFDHHLWFLLNKLTQETRQSLWENNIGHLDFQQALPWAILSLYPKLIPFSIFSALPREHKENAPKEIVFSERYNFLHGSGFIFEVFESNEHIRNQYIHEFKNLQFAFDPLRKERNLLEWFKDVQQATSLERWTDPRLSEWTMLEIIIQIVDAYNEKISDKENVIFHGLDLSNFHPANFIVPKKWIVKTNRLTWGSWKSRMRSKERIKLVSTENQVDDFRYFASEKNWQSKFIWLFGDIEQSIIVCLSVLLVQMTSRSFFWPATASKQKFIDELFSYAVYVIESESLSTDTRLLIAAILSRKEIGLYYGEEPIKLTNNKHLKTLSQFKIELVKIQKSLEKYQFSMRNKMPRQLTVIDLDAMNMTPEKFFQIQND